MAGLGGVVGTVLGWLGYQLGQRTDGASSSGSLHAKMTDAKNAIVTAQNNILAAANRAPYVNGKSVTITYGYSGPYLAGNSTTELLTVNGPRIILGGYISIVSFGGDYIRHTLKLDDFYFINNNSGSNIVYDRPYYWAGRDIGSTSYRSRFAYRDPRSYTFSPGSDPTWGDAGAPAGEFIINFPPLTLINNSLSYSIQNTGSSSASISYGYGIWHTSA